MHYTKLLSMLITELRQLVLPQKYQQSFIIKRWQKHYQILFSIFGIVYFLYNEIFELNLNVYNITSHNLISSILEYINSSKKDLKVLYTKINTDAVKKFFITKRNAQSLSSQINILFQPFENNNGRDYFITEIDLKPYQNINPKHFEHTLFSDPLYYEPCIHFIPKYKYIYALPFYSLSPIILIHNIMSDVFMRLKEGFVTTHQQCDKTQKIHTKPTNNPFDNIEFNEFNIINEMFFNIKTSGGALTVPVDLKTTKHGQNCKTDNDHQDRIEYKTNIDVLLFSSEIDMSSLVRVKHKPNILKRLYIMTDVKISENLLIPVIYEQLLYSRGVVFCEIMPFELNVCRINSIIFLSSISLDEKTNATVEKIIENSPQKYTKNVLFQSLVRANNFLYKNIKDFANPQLSKNYLIDSNPIIFNLFRYWLDEGFVPSMIMCRQINNFNIAKQEIENIEEMGIFVCGNQVCYFKLQNIQNIIQPIAMSSILPTGFYLKPKNKLIRITQTIFYNKHFNAIFFSNLALMNSNINVNARIFFKSNRTFKTSSIDSVIQMIEEASVLSFQSKNKLATISYEDSEYFANDNINLYKLSFDRNLDVFAFTNNNNVDEDVLPQDYSLTDVVDKIIQYNNLPIARYKSTPMLNDFIFNLLNIQELYR